MSRQDITNIYETTIASRAQTIALLNEVTNSKQNVERFNNAYSKWFIMTDKAEKYEDIWSWPWNENTGIKPVKNYSDLVIDYAYPDVYKCYLISKPHVNVSSFLRVLQDSKNNEARIATISNTEKFKIKIRSLLHKAENQNSKYSTDTQTGIHSRTFSPVLLIPAQGAASKGCGWNIEVERAGIPKDHGRDYGRIKARFVVNEYIICFLLIYFEKIKDIMPIKDVFKYGSVLKLIEAMDAAKSQRSKKRVVRSQTIEGVLFENDKFLMYEPPTWMHSRKYFGAPVRTSLLDDTLQPGASWCTSSSNENHFTEYVTDLKNNLYYFIDKNPTVYVNDQLYAVRTLGGEQDVNKIITTLKTTYNDWMGARAEIVVLREKFLEYCLNRKENTLTWWQEICNQNFSMYMEAATIEIRNQNNQALHHWPRCTTANFNENWFRENIVFIDGVDQSKK